MAKRKSKSKSIDEYREKRNFERTPEPPPSEPTLRPGAPAFVVHRHEARRRHYDLRLERDGVLKSWAVPRGFSYEPSVKRRAVRTEDHPLEYEHFSGVIPKDAYGAGTMMIWDRGSYQIPKDKDGSQGAQDGKLELALFGKKLRGEWHLVRTKSGKDEWLIFKAKDGYARTEDDPAPFFDLTRAAEAPAPQYVPPMEIGEPSQPFSNPGWLFEMKFRGQRAMFMKHGDTVRILTPDGSDLARKLPALVEQATQLRASGKRFP